MTDLPQNVRILTDVSALGIALTERHPAHEYVFPYLRDGLDGPNVVLVPGYYPLRVQHLMTNSFGVSSVDARNAIQSLVESPARIIGVTATDVSGAYEISAEKSHDVYDSFLISLGRERSIDYLLTTDTDFERLCDDEEFTYLNPIPDEELTLLSEPGG